MEIGVIVMGTIIEDKESIVLMSETPHRYGSYIIGRVDPPYKKKQANITSVVVDAPSDIINTLSRKPGNIRGVSAKVLHSKA